MRRDAVLSSWAASAALSGPTWRSQTALCRPRMLRCCERVSVLRRCRISVARESPWDGFEPLVVNWSPCATPLHQCVMLPRFQRLTPISRHSACVLLRFLRCVACRVVRNVAHEGVDPHLASFQGVRVGLANADRPSPLTAPACCSVRTWWGAPAVKAPMLLRIRRCRARAPGRLFV